MQIVSLYRYTRPDGGVTVSTKKPDVECIELYRLVADDGMALTNGNVVTVCVDTDTLNGWVEIPEPEDTTE